MHERMRHIVAQFLERNLVPAGEIERFRAAIRNAMAWRNSIRRRAALVGLVFSLGYYLRAEPLAVKASTWYASRLRRNHARRAVVQVGEQSDLAVPPPAVGLPAGDLGAVPLAGFEDRST